MDKDDVLVPPDTRAALDALSLLSKKWDPVVLVVLLESGPLRFSELERTIPGISPNMLTQTLESLSEHGLVGRSVLSESPLRVTYELTDAGYEMQPVFDSLSLWGNEHIDSVQPTVVLADRDRRLVDLYSGWLRDRFEVIEVRDREQLQRRLHENPDVVVFDTDLWADEPAIFDEHCPGPTRRIALVSDRPEPSLCDWPVDDILRKLLSKDVLITAVVRQVERIGQTPADRDREAIESKLSLLESEHSKLILEDDPRVENAHARLRELESKSVRES
ncbi:winged helix-turn-helix transcriptional regulator [Natrarchaeobius chitinivorans]|uniref:Transcriptional regulator n=1 Tax=Natrarchaeobius chitinivorans TaxID=1679083 RepID=A0A3N6M5B6_NATCH|nr:helix-turn-helix domain-containing protein [Natrarchaeobius chitinivorans]RQG97247.1 transcriptional regulator [Natrarchaeobius chitinivorans]